MSQSNRTVIDLKTPHQPALENARVRGGEDGVWMLECRGQILSARAAVSCLVVPQSGDRVLVSCQGREVFILAVLERPDEATVELASRGPMEIRGGRGGLRIHHEDTLEISAGELKQHARQWQVSAVEANLTAVDTTVSSTRLVAQASQASLNADSLMTVADSVTQRFKSLMRWVEGVESAQVGDLVQNIRRSLTQRAMHALITARKDVRIDGERINMG